MPFLTGGVPTGIDKMAVERGAGPRGVAVTAGGIPVPLTPAQEISRLGGRLERPVEVRQRVSRKARHVKLVTFEQQRALQVELFQASSAVDLQAGLAAWLASQGANYAILDVRTEVSTTFDSDSNNVVRTFFGEVLYAPNDDGSTFEDAINDWLVQAGEKDFIEIHFEHTDLIYRAIILYAE